MALARSDIVLGVVKLVFAVASIAAVVIMIRVNQYELWKYHAIVMLDAVALACGVFIAVVSRNSVERVLYVLTSLCLIASVFLTISTLGLTQSYMESLPEIIRKLTPGIDA